MTGDGNGVGPIREGGRFGALCHLIEMLRYAGDTLRGWGREDATCSTACRESMLVLRILSELAFSPRLLYGGP